MLKIILVICFGLGNFVFSQSENVDIYKDSLTLTATTSECDIIFKDGRELKKVKINGIRDTMFSVTKTVESNRSFPINEIKRITFQKHGFWPGMLYGYLGTVALGAAITLATREGGHPGRGIIFLGSLVIGIPIALVSGIISEIAAGSDVYDFPGNNTNAKIKRLKYIISEQK